jgi:pyrroline-5-carboxylate reductase
VDKKTIAFIGCGNMAGSMIRGLVADGYPKEKLWATNRQTDRLNELADQLGVHVTSDNLEAVLNADVLVLAVKPKVMRQLCNEIKETVQKQKPLIISVAIGVSAEMLSNWLGEGLAIVRSMPNTPSLIGAGAAGLFENAEVSAAEHDVAESIHRAVGMVIWVKQESLIDVVASLSGSGPAYFFYFMELMEKTACNLGLDGEAANLLALQTALGASKLAIESSDSVEVLRRKVTSPKGTTEQALAVFQAYLPEVVEKAMHAAVKRAGQLTNDLAKEE